MLGVGFPELFFIAVIALVIFGPNRLPEIARSAGSGIRRARAFLANAMESLDEEAKGITNFATELQSLTPRGIMNQVLASDNSSRQNSDTPPVRVSRNNLRTDFDPDAT
ncbi:MAG: twin-arginine translocase TatA/TatE family subunit [Actinomycetes bacterium]